MSTKPLLSRSVLAAITVAAGISVAGCGSNSNPDLANGKELFSQKCASCHTLARADAKGVYGPNLDAAFRRSRIDGMPDSTIAAVVDPIITFPPFGEKLVMPAKLVSGSDRRDVAAYIGFAAGRPGKDTGVLALAGKAAAGKNAVAGEDGTVNILADPSGRTAYDTATATAKAGDVTFIMGNPSSSQHNVALKGAGVNEQGKIVGKGGTSQVSADLKPGTYTFYCSVPGHEAGGMKGTLTVK